MQKIVHLNRAPIWLAISGDRVVAAKKQEIALQAFEGMFQERPIKMMEVYFFMEPQAPRIIKPTVID